MTSRIIANTNGAVLRDIMAVTNPNRAPIDFSPTPGSATENYPMQMRTWTNTSPTDTPATRVARFYSAKELEYRIFGLQAEYHNFFRDGDDDAQASGDGRILFDAPCDHTFQPGTSIPINVSANITNSVRVENFRSGGPSQPSIREIYQVQTHDTFLRTNLLTGLRNGTITAPAIGAPWVGLDVNSFLWDLDNRRILPAITNMPPVFITGNVIPDLFVFRRPVGGNWSVGHRQDVSTAFDQAGEYFVIASYGHQEAAFVLNPSLGESAAGQHRFFQVFYFRINDFVDARILTRTGFVFSFNEAVQSGVIIDDQNFIVFLHNYGTPDGRLGPHERLPIIYLEHVLFRDSRLLQEDRPIENKFISPIRVRQDGKMEIVLDNELRQRDRNGFYFFRVFFGNGMHPIARFDFTVVVDTESLRGLQFRQGGETVDQLLRDPIDYALGIDYIDDFRLMRHDPDPANNNEITICWDTKESFHYLQYLSLETMNNFGIDPNISQFATVDVWIHEFTNDNSFFAANGAVTRHPGEVRWYNPNTNEYEYRDRLYTNTELNIHVDPDGDGIGQTNTHLKLYTYLVRATTTTIINGESVTVPNPHARQIWNERTGQYETRDRWIILSPTGIGPFRGRPEWNPTTPGLYIVEAVDVMRNRTPFAFMIDNSTPGFRQVQNPDFTSGPNIVSAPSVRVYFGDEKIIRAENFEAAFRSMDESADQRITRIFESVGRSQFPCGTPFFNPNPDASQTINPGREQHILIPMSTAANAREVRGEHDTYTPLTSLTSDPLTTPITNAVLWGENYNAVQINNPTRYDDGFFFMRSRDVLGNEGDWYVWMNRDRSRVIIYQDNMMLPNREPGEDTRIVNPRGGMAAARNVFLQFHEALSDSVRPQDNFGRDENGNEGRRYIVEALVMNFYAFNWDDLDSPNWPFAREATRSNVLLGGTAHTERYQIQHGFDGVRAPTTPFIHLNPDETTGMTRPGMYKITRYYDLTYHRNDGQAGGVPSATTAWNDQIRNYFFIVDRNPVMPLGANDQWRSDILFEFPDKPNVSADWSHFVFNDEIETNMNTVMNLPNHGTKYGESSLMALHNFQGWPRGPSGNATITRPFSVRTSVATDGYQLLWDPGRLGPDGAHFRTTNFPSLELHVDYSTAGVVGPARQIATGEWAWPNSFTGRPNFEFTTHEHNGLQRITIRDGSRGIAWRPMSRSNVDLDAAGDTNASTVNLNMRSGYMQVYWYLGDGVNHPVRLDQGEEHRFHDWQFGPDGHLSHRHDTQLRPHNTLEFTFVNNPENFFSPIDPTPVNPATGLGSIGIWLGANRTRNLANEITPESSGMMVSYDVTRFIPNIVTSQFVMAEASDTNGTNWYTIVVDNDPPIYNLQRIRNQDALYTVNPPMPAAISSGFVFSLTNDFRFILAPEVGVMRPSNDTHFLQFRSVNSDLRPSGIHSMFRQIPYVTTVDESTPENPLSFAHLVGFPTDSDFVRFFEIRETDIAGNVTNFFVRLMGDNYVYNLGVRGVDGAYERLSTQWVPPIRQHNLLAGASNQPLFETVGSNRIPIINPATGLTQRRTYANIEQKFARNLVVDNITGFWNDNPNFEMHFTTPLQTVPRSFVRNRFSADPNHQTQTSLDFASFLDQMFAASVSERMVNITLRTGFGELRHRLGGVSPDIDVANLSVTRLGENHNTLRVTISNMVYLNNLMPNNRFTLFLYRVRDNGMGYYGTPVTIPADNRGNVAGTVVQGPLTGGFTGVTFDGDIFVDLPGFGNNGISYVIKVFDSFGRLSSTEHHPGGGQHNVNMHSADGTAPHWEGGVNFVGHSDGVTMTWDAAVLDLYVDGICIRVLIDEQPAWYNRISGYVPQPPPGIRPFSRTATIRPVGFNDMTEWTVRFRFRASGEWATNPYTWRFHHVLPEITFRNLNGTVLEPIYVSEDESFIDFGDLNSIINLLINRDVVTPPTVNFTVRHTRTTITFINDAPVEDVRVTQVPRIQTQFNVEYVGAYVLEIESSIGTRRVYHFNIAEVDNLTYRLVFTCDLARERILERSPVMYDMMTHDTRITPDGRVMLDEHGIPLNIVESARRRPVPVYWMNVSVHHSLLIDTGEFSYQNGVLTEIEEPTLKSAVTPDGQLEFRPSMNIRRRLVHVESGSNGSDIDWQKYFLFSEDTGARFYFIVAQTSSVPDIRYQITPTTPTTGVYRIFRNIDNDITVRLANSSPVGPDGSVESTNVFLMDFYFNGEYGGRIFFGDYIRITDRDAGIINLHMLDWAGNRREFRQEAMGGTGDATRHQRYFTLYNLTCVPLLINGEAAINGMLYTDTELNINTPRITAFGAATSFFIQFIRVHRNGALVGEHRAANINDAPPLNLLNHHETGQYTVLIEYNAGFLPGARDPLILTQTFDFQFVNTNDRLSSFTFAGATNITIDGVFFGPRMTNVSSTVLNGNNSSMSLNRYNGAGMYTIRLLVDQTGVRQQLIRLRTINLSVFTGNLENLLRSDRTFGGSHRGNVQIIFNPNQIINASPTPPNPSSPATIRIYLNNNLYRQYRIFNGMRLDPNNEDEFPIMNDALDNDIIRTMTRAGHYRVTLTDARGAMLMQNSFEITEGMSTGMIYIVILALVGLAVLAVIFLRLRAKMRVR
ncbi:MAG: hypothetical protein FWC00_00805 [Firmicutes bacterium]|nr:hypothetical protein [Bacillota bacterium]